MCACKLLLISQDLEYGRAFARAVSSLHKEFELELRHIVEEIIFDNGFDFIMADETLKQQLPVFNHQWSDNRIIFLTEDPVEQLNQQEMKENSHFWYIHKYQNIHSILSDLNYIFGIVAGKKNYIKSRNSPDLIGFYSTGGGTGKTAITLGVAKELTKYHEKRVFYLSFEEIPSTELYFNTALSSRNMADYLYYLLEIKKEELCSKPECFTCQDQDGVETISPGPGRNDLCLLSQDEIVCLIKTVTGCERYDYILLDLKNDLNPETLTLLSLCTKNFIIETDDPVSKAKHLKLLDFFNQCDCFGSRDDWVMITNQCEKQELHYDQEATFPADTRKKIRIEREDSSFSMDRGKICIDTSHSFGLGMKKIAEEILLRDV